MKTIAKLFLVVGVGGFLIGLGGCARSGNRQAADAGQQAGGARQMEGQAAAQLGLGVQALGEGLFARISTTRGDIITSLEFERTPLTVVNFVALAEGTMAAAEGRRFFDGLTFHRVIADFMIQGGCPQGTGSGGPGYRFPDEIVPELRHDGPGVLSMANAGPGTNGSQFFITHVATPWLDGGHTVFGRVVQGQSVVDAIQVGDRINSVTIIRNGAAANAFRADQAAFDALLPLVSEANAERIRLEREAAAQRALAQRETDLALVREMMPEARVTPSGIHVVVERSGTGIRPAAGQTVQVSYTGALLSGEVFDSSEFHGRPIEFQAGIGRVIRGWDEMVLDMQVGERRRVAIPPELGYGEQGFAGVIPPHSFLVFDMELVSAR